MDSALNIFNNILSLRDVRAAEPSAAKVHAAVSSAATDSDIPPPPPPPLQREPCFFFQVGSCKFGKDCPNLHDDENQEAPAPARSSGFSRSWNSKGRAKSRMLCAFFEAGCCTSGADCKFKHADVPEALGLRTTRCVRFFSSGQCEKDSCTDAHHEWDLRTPEDFAGFTGYKRALCTHHAVPDLLCSKESYKCFDAHGELDQRRAVLALPRATSDVSAASTFMCIQDSTDIWASKSDYEVIGRLIAGAIVTSSGAVDPSDRGMLSILPRGAVEMKYLKPVHPARAAELVVEYEFTDAHIHLDQVLQTRKWGSAWMYKTLPCRFHTAGRCPYSVEECVWAHSAADTRTRLPYSIDDFAELFQHASSLPGARFAGCVTSCCGTDAIEETLKLVEWGKERLNGRIYACFGIHPSVHDQWSPEVEARLEEALDQCGDKAVAWGECGLDYNKMSRDWDWETGIRPRMHSVFIQQAQIAVRRGLPLVIHSRDAIDETLKVLSEHVPPSHPVYMHSFMGTPEQMHRFLEHWQDGYIGITGALTWQIATKWKGGMADLARAISLDHLLLETDGPFMPPVPHQGEASHSGQVALTAAEIARYKGLDSPYPILAAATRNFRNFYRIS